MPSSYEGLGLVAAEAIARGAPVAGYDVDGLRDLVPPSGGGVLVPAGAVLALAEATWSCLTMRNGSEAAAAREWLRRNHSWDAVGRRLVEVYQSAR
jgi:glycosyltransferase involved in cell wall biosynthesis